MEVIEEMSETLIQKCTRQHVIIANVHVKSHSAQVDQSLFSVSNVFEKIMEDVRTQITSIVSVLERCELGVRQVFHSFHFLSFF